MEHTLTINNRDFTYTLKRRRYQRRVNMIVHQDGTLIVTAPKTCPMLFIRKVLHKHKDWLAKRLHVQSTAQVTIDPRVVRHVKEATRRLVHAKLQQFNALYGFSYNRVAIRQQRSIWGSCSAQKNLNFNCKILGLPEHLQDYIIVHELCHLKELNHSARFWHLVEQAIPDHKALRLELRRWTK